jgi:hypothetical protein
MAENTKRENTTLWVSRDFAECLRERMDYEDTYESYLREELELTNDRKLIYED